MRVVSLGDCSGECYVVKIIVRHGASLSAASMMRAAAFAALTLVADVVRQVTRPEPVDWRPSSHARSSIRCRSARVSEYCFSIVIPPPAAGVGWRYRSWRSFLILSRYSITAPMAPAPGEPLTRSASLALSTLSDKEAAKSAAT